MRQINLLILLSLTAALTAGAQSTTQPRVGFYLALDNNAGPLRSEAGYLAGAEVGVILSRHFSIGLSGYGLANEEALVPGPGSATAPDTLRFGYGGIRVGYLFRPDARFHPTVDLTLGGGRVSAEGSTPEREDEVFVAEPSVMMEANFARYVRGALGLSYRLVSGSHLAGVSDASSAASAAGSRCASAGSESNVAVAHSHCQRAGRRAVRRHVPDGMRAARSPGFVCDSQRAMAALAGRRAARGTPRHGG